MSLIISIKTIVNTLYPNATFILASSLRANLASEIITTAKLPLIVLDNTLKKNNKLEKNSSISKRTELRMLFLTKVNFDINDDSQNTYIEEMELIADRIFNNIYQLESVRVGFNEVQDYTTQPVFKIFNAILSGIEAKAQFRESVIIPYCTTLPIEEEEPPIEEEEP